MRKITYPNGEKLTRSVVPFDVDDVLYFPKDDTINEVLPRIDKEYHKLVNAFQNEGLETFPSALDKFFMNTSRFAIVGGLMAGLLSDLDIDVNVIERAFRTTDWYRQTIVCIQSEFRKNRKVDPINYAESVRQLIEVFGLTYALASLAKEGVGMKKSTAMALCRIGGETPTIKNAVRKGLKLTIAFELPNINQEERERLAEELVSKSYAEAKRYLKEWKASQNRI